MISTRRRIAELTAVVFLVAIVGYSLWRRNESFKSLFRWKDGMEGKPHEHRYWAKEHMGVPTLQELSAFQEFETKFEKTYDSEKERARRFSIFRENLAYIEKHNSEARVSGVELKMNGFGDQHRKEFAAMLGIDLGDWRVQNKKGMRSQNEEGESRESTPITDVEKKDWVEEGAVTPIKNQGQCGSCWAFSVTGALEGALKIARGSLVSLSEQEFVDCDPVDRGCNGGIMDQAFEYAEMHAICTEQSYAYHAKENDCEAAKKKCTVGIEERGVIGFKDVTRFSEQALLGAIKQQPTSVAIQADTPVFQFYHKGVLSQKECGSTLDHAVLAVGYGVMDGKPYYKVKNSWGAHWGENGFVYIGRGEVRNEEGNNVGVCGILSIPSYPEIKDKDQSSEA